MTSTTEQVEHDRLICEVMLQTMDIMGADTPAKRVDALLHMAVGALPAWRVRASNAEDAVRNAAHLSGQHVLSIERVEEVAA